MMPASTETSGARAVRTLYLDLMKRVLTNVIYEDERLLDLRGETAFDLEARTAGLDWPSQAHTMIGLKRLDNLQHCIEYVIEHDIPGDLIETGVWRGGACIFMRAMLRAYDVHDRLVWLADSFAGLPEPGERSHATDHCLAGTISIADLNRDLLAVPVETVRRNFERYGLLDEQVRFLEGWFRDTLPTAPIDRLAVIRLDGDMYESTMDALTSLYPKLSVGGFVIIDDYILEMSSQAVHDYRATAGVHDPIQQIDTYGAFWQRSA
jgi:Macrocin-O-methyltransferase (TylF)